LSGPPTVLKPTSQRERAGAASKTIGLPEKGAWLTLRSKILVETISLPRKSSRRTIVDELSPKLNAYWRSIGVVPRTSQESGTTDKDN